MPSTRPTAQLHLTPAANGSKFVLNDVDISNFVSGVDLHAHVGEATSMQVTFPAVDVSIDGELDDVTCIGHSARVYAPRPLAPRHQWVRG